MNTVFSYTEESGGFFMPPDVQGEPITWDHLCEVNGRHYGVAYFPLPEQDDRIDLMIHDLSTESDVKQIIETFGRPYRLYRLARAEAYPPIGDQLDTILKTFNSILLGGTDLPQDMADLLTQWRGVKDAYPKPYIPGD